MLSRPGHLALPRKRFFENDYKRLHFVHFESYDSENEEM